jgi:hypothetical protein
MKSKFKVDVDSTWYDNADLTVLRNGQNGPSTTDRLELRTRLCRQSSIWPAVFPALSSIWPV